MESQVYSRGMKKSSSMQRMQHLHQVDSEESALGLSLSPSTSSMEGILRREEIEEKSVAKVGKMAKKKVNEPACQHEDCRRTIFINSVPHSMDKYDLKEFFEPFGQISNAEIILNKRTHLSKGIATVTFERLEDAKFVLNYPKDKLVCGKKILNPILNRCLRIWKFNKNKSKEKIEHTSSKMNVEESHDGSLINAFPNEILSYIFSYLDVKERIRIERVCKRWRHIGKNIPWSDIQTLVFREVFKGAALADRLDSKILYEILSRCGATIKELDFADCPHQLSRQYPVIITNHCPNLVKINAERTELDNKSLKILAEETPKLKSINLSTCTVISETGVKHLLISCTELSELYLDNIKNFSGICLEHLSEKMALLSLNSCVDLRSVALKNIRNRCTNLQILRLSSCGQLDIEFSLSEMFKVLTANLTELCMAGYFQNLTTQDFVQSFKFCKNLRVLNLEANVHIDNSVIEVISSQCQDLEYLNISQTNITDESFLYIRFLAKLRSLFINYNTKITDIGMEQLAQTASLEKLEARGCIISDGGCIEIVRNCHTLNTLDVSNCFEVTQKTVSQALIRKLNRNKLTIIAGGTSVENFVTTEHLKIVDVNKCPYEFRYVHGLYVHNDDFDEDAAADFDYEEWDDYDVDDLEDINNGFYDNELEEMM